MAEKSNWVQRIAEGAEICDQSLPGVPIVEIAGDKRILVEHHGGVVEYGPERIRIRVNFGTLCICGTCMELKQMSKQQLIISGRIDCVQIQRGCR